MIRIVGPRDKRESGWINVTSSDLGWSRALSPFVLGPITIPYGPTQPMLDRVRAAICDASPAVAERIRTQVLEPMLGDTRALRVENAWQYSKVYEDHDADGIPDPSWFVWRAAGFSLQRAVRYPRGKGAKPLYSWVGGKRLDRIQARRELYIPIYAEAARRTEAYKRLQALHMGGPITLWDFDGYDHRALGMSYDDVIDCEERSLGHAFVLAMMLEGLV